MKEKEGAHASTNLIDANNNVSHQICGVVLHKFIRVEDFVGAGRVDFIPPVKIQSRFNSS